MESGAGNLLFGRWGGMATTRQLMAAVLLGLLVRAWRGFDADPFSHSPFACLAAVLAGPTFLDLRRKEPDAPVLRLVGWAVARACGSVGIMVAVPLVALNYPWYETWLLPQWPVALDAVLLSLASATGAAAMTALLLARLSGGAVKWILRTFFLVGLVAWRFAPGAWGNSTIVTVLDWGVSTTALSMVAVFVAADAAFIYLLMRKTSPESASQSSASACWWCPRRCGRSWHRDTASPPDNPW